MVHAVGSRKSPKANPTKCYSGELRMRVAKRVGDVMYGAREGCELCANESVILSYWSMFKIGDNHCC